MPKNLLSVDRMIENRNPGLIEPQMSVIAVNINREELENIRKKKGIPVRVLEKKINLSKSRYYRWLQYQIDLPMEMTIGLKKVLNISNNELLSLFVSSTDEQLQLLTLILYTSNSSDSEEFSQFIDIRNRLTKYRSVGDENISYKLMLAYTDIVVNYLQGKSMTKPHEIIENYFLGTDYLGIFDILLYLGTLKAQEKFKLPINSMNKGILLLENEILRKLNTQYFGDSMSILVGCVIDLVNFYKQESPERANVLISHAMKILSENNQLTTYTECIFKFMDNVVNGEEQNEKLIFDFKASIQNSLWCLPKSDVKYLQELVKEEEYTFEKMGDKYY
ncbi:helix-turn-helix domain-containing protein [Enterococcus sp. AZ103]|uniref:helix-turn-helix domain-containing protein n=1 Tax=Enterococcus sp. AZ103 TaxID=2774628 RepID=UPI003F24C0FC